MFEKDYYCLIAGLPDLFLNDYKLAFNSLKFRLELKQILTASDYKLVEYLFLPFDNENLIHLLFHQKKQFNCHAVFSKKILENEILKADVIPDYMVRFLKWNNLQENKDFSLKKENKLHTFFYAYVLDVKNEFLKNWFLFELNIKNILTALNYNRFNYKSENQLILLNPNSEVELNLVNNRLKSELFEEDLPFAEQIFKVAESNDNLLEKEKAIDKIKWEYLDEFTFFHYFTIEKILSYVSKLFIIERWMKLDAKTGKELLNKLLNELKTSYEFSAEFSTAK